MKAAERREFEMSETQLAKILEACKDVPMIALQCGTPRSPQENATTAWRALGLVMGFDAMTVGPCVDKSDRFFIAAPTRDGETS